MKTVFDINNFFHVLFQVVIDASKKYLPEMAVGMSHPKVKLFVGDGLEYLQKEETKYDVVIADLSDPEDGGNINFC